MTPVEIIVVVLAILAIIKAIALIGMPKFSVGFAKKVYSKPGLLQIGALIVAAIVLYYLLGEMTIVQILAAVAFGALLFVIGLASEAEHIIQKYEKKLKSGKMWKDYWLYMLVWLVLIVWALVEIFA